jgi:hypothetical protein
MMLRIIHGTVLIPLNYLSGPADPLQRSRNIRCFSNMRRLASNASSSDSAISEPWPVSSASLTITRWLAIWTANSAMCRLACVIYF